jgi:hypothetical protein
MSTKSIADKLLIKPDTSCWAWPAAQAKLLEPLPAGARWAKTLGSATVGVLFVPDAAATRDALKKHKDQLTRPEVLWIAYPKGNRSDINRDSLWPLVAEYGMRPVTQVSVDDVWSALRFRLLKEGEPPFTGGR